MASVERFRIVSSAGYPALATSAATTATSAAKVTETATTSAASMATTATETATTATETAKALAKVTSAAKALAKVTSAAKALDPATTSAAKALDPATTSAASMATTATETAKALDLAKVTGFYPVNSFMPGAANNHDWTITMADNNWTIGANHGNKTITIENVADVDKAAKILGKELSLSLTGRMGNYSYAHTYGIKEFAIEWEVGIAAKSVYFRANPVRVNDSVDGTRVMFYIVSEDWKELMRAWDANKR